MPNPYDQFDAPASSSNPYDQFDDQPTPKKPEPKKYTLPEAVKAGFKNAGKSAVEFGTTAKNAYLSLQDPKDVVGKAAGFAASVPGAVGNLAGGMYSFLLPADVQRQLAEAKPEMRGAADKVLQDYYDRYHDWEAVKRGIAEHPYKFMADVATVVTLPADVATVTARTGVLGTTAKTAAKAAMEPKTVSQLIKNVPRYVAVPTHGIGDVADTVAGRAIPWAAGKVTRPTNAFMRRNLEGRGPQALEAIRNAKAPLPGHTPTTAQALGPAAVPRMQAQVSAAAKRLPAQAVDQVAAQNAARLAQIRRIGEIPGHPNNAGMTLDDRVKALFEQRKADRINDYGISDSLTGTATPRMMEILDLPLNKNVLNRAKTLAAQQERPFDVGTPARAEQLVPDPYGQDLPPTVVPGQPAVYPQWSGLDLDTIKKAFDDLAFPSATDPVGGLKPNELAALRASRADFLKEADALIPEYGAARAKYAENTKLWNRARIAQYLEQRLTNPTLADDTLTQRADTFANAVNDAPKANPSVNKVTGEARRLEEILTPEEMGYVQSVLSDLTSAKLGEQQALAGSRYGSELDTIMTDALPFVPGTPLTREIANLLLGGVNRRMGDKVSNAMMTPDGTAGLIEDVLTSDARRAAVRNWYDRSRMVNRFINPINVGNRYPSLYNAMAAPQQDPQTR